MNDLHASQRIFWDQEHASPLMVLNMDYKTPSRGVVRFFEPMKEHLPSAPLSGIEMGCGKGRNAIWLAQQGVSMSAFDFSVVAIEEAKRRRKEAQVPEEECVFFVHDATARWPFPDHSCDFGIDCFASTDIESLPGRSFVRDEWKRVLKPGGLLFVYAISSASPFHSEMLRNHPAAEKNAYFHPGLV